MEQESTFDDLLAELARAYTVRIPNASELAERAELIERLVQKVRREFTAERIKSLTADQLKAECARLHRILGDLQCRLEIINEVIAQSHKQR